MVDIVDAATRSRMMASIGPKDTAPELAVRRYLHGLGLRYRVHDRSLPGRPDLVLPAFKAVVFVHGCFWHRHPGCEFATNPTTRADFWQRKFEANVRRDRAKEEALRLTGWRVFVVWGCQTEDEHALEHLFWSLVAGPIVDDLCERNRSSIGNAKTAQSRQE